jgi:hypothetical protein
MIYSSFLIGNKPRGDSFGCCSTMDKSLYVSDFGIKLYFRNKTFPQHSAGHAVKSGTCSV